MNPQPKSFHLPLALILIIVGGIVILFGKTSPMTESTGVNLLISISGCILWIWGCCHMAAAKGLSASFGLLGLLFIVGLILIFVIAQKQPEMARAAARRRAQNPHKEYRGDPDSPY